MTHLETKQSRMIKEQAEYMAGHEARRREAEQRNGEVDARFGDRLNADSAAVVD